jgi:hypothetical protein
LGARLEFTETDEITTLPLYEFGGDMVNGTRTTRFTIPFTPSFTMKAMRTYRNYRGCASRDRGFVRGQNTDLGWSDPTFGQVLVAKRPQGSLQPT